MGRVKQKEAQRFGKWLIPVSGGIIITVSGVGLYIDAQGFIENLLSEVVGIFAGIIVALLVVDRYIKHQNERQWAKVRNLTYTAIINHLCDMAVEAIIHFLVKDHRLITPIIGGRDQPNPSTIAAMAELVSLLRQVQDVDSEGRSTSDIAVEFYEEVEWDLDQIQDVLTPRVVQSPAEQQVIDALIEFDHARHRLHNAIIAHKRIATHGVLPHVIELIERAQGLYSVIYKTWK